MEKPSLEIGNSNWAIKEGELLGYNRAGNDYLPIPITMTRASLGTRVNPEGLVEDVELLGSEEVTNGDFSSGTTGWTEIGDFAISGGKASITSASQYSQLTSQQGTNFLTSGKQYKLQVDIETLSISGVFAYRVTGGAVTPILTSDLVDGVYTTYFTMISDGYIWFQTTGSYTGLNVTIDNVSVKEATIDNLARVDYDGTASSLLVEPQRTNLVTYSEELSATTNVTLSNTISPDGTLSGLKINETTSNSQHYSTSYGASVVSGGTIYTVSFYIKKGTYDLVKVYTQSSRVAASINITFSTESTSASGSDFVSGSNFMEDAGNGWYRVGFSATANTTGEVSIYLSPKDLSTYAGDISQYTEYWGMQIEEGSYATSYIPTDGGTITRVQETYEKTGISNLINSTEGVLFVEMARQEGDTSAGLITLNDGTNSQTVSLYYFSTGTIYFDILSGSPNVSQGVSGIDTYSFNKIAIKYKSGDIALWVNGVEVYTSASAISLTGLNTLSFSQGNDAYPFYGKVKQLQVYKTALTDDELTILTGTSGVHFFPSYASMASDLTYTIE